MIIHSKKQTIQNKKIKIYTPDYVGYKINKTRKYNTGILLITNTRDAENFKLWLFWHLEILNFDCVIIIDNDAKIDIKEISKPYKDRVIYNKISGKIAQYKIYNDFLNNNDLIDWVLFIDDDEFLYISDKFNNKIKNVLDLYKDSYKLSVSSLIMRSEKILNDKMNFINDAIYTIPLDFYENKLIKSIVNCNIGHIFIDSTIPLPCSNIKVPENLLQYYSDDDYEVVGTPHNPMSHDGNDIIFSKNISTGIIDIGLNTRKLFNDINDIEICLLHFKYNTEKNWSKKINNVFNDINDDYFKRVYNDDYYNLIYTLPIEKFIKPKELLKKYNFKKANRQKSH